MRDNEVPSRRQMRDRATSDGKLEDLVRRVVDAIGAVCPLLRGRLIQVAVAPGGSTTIKHKLGRPLQGCIVCGVKGGPNLLEQVTADEETIELHNHHSRAVTTTLWVF